MKLVSNWGVVLVLVAAGMLTGCGDDTARQPAARPPVTIRAGDACHVDGMDIKRFPGPKAEAYVQGRKRPYEFCSTTDFFGWLLQPDVQATVQEIYVHDMGRTDWKDPADAAFIDARTAWYVVGSDRRGAMGPTLAPFGTQEQARAFARRHGGEVLSFKQIDLAVVERLAAPAKGTMGPGAMPGMTGGAHERAPGTQ